MIEIRQLAELGATALAPLRDEAAAEGFRFVERLFDEWEAGRERFDGAGAVLLGAFEGGTLVAIGGLTADPYAVNAALGRLRHVYVRHAARRCGVGRQLVRTLEAAACGRYEALALRTDTAVGARFYEALGYVALPPGGTATHRRALPPSIDPRVAAI
jgi:GNAT superfamily N-acetyltransferase